MRLLAALAATGLAMAGGGAHAASVEVKDAVARVVVIPEARSDIKVEFLTNNPGLPLKVRTLGDRVIVDGDLDRRIRSCHSNGANIRVRVSGVGEVAYEDMPQIVIRTPRDVNIETGGAVFGSVGKSASLDLSNAGCGDWTVANVAGKMKINQAGSGNTVTGTSGEAVVRIAGSGDVRTGEIAGAMTAEVAGSGDINAASISGPLSVKLAGSGDVRIAGGHATEMMVSIAGSGDVSLDGVADSLRARIAGSGDVRVRQVNGPISKAIVGSGGVSIG
jgi:hypothetical protein